MAAEKWGKQMRKVNPINPIKRKWLKELRNNKKQTVRGIAPLLGISWQHYSDIENGRKNPSIELSLAMAKYFDVSVELFLDDRTKFQVVNG